MRRLDSENDGNREGLRLMGSVANEERIDGEVETGNPDLRDQNPPLVDDLSYSSIMRKNREYICIPFALANSVDSNFGSLTRGYVRPTHFFHCLLAISRE